jgi:hypothetical protein
MSGDWKRRRTSTAPVLDSTKPLIVIPAAFNSRMAGQAKALFSSEAGQSILIQSFKGTSKNCAIAPENHPVLVKWCRLRMEGWTDEPARIF